MSVGKDYQDVRERKFDQVSNWYFSCFFNKLFRCL